MPDISLNDLQPPVGWRWWDAQSEGDSRIVHLSNPAEFRRFGDYGATLQHLISWADTHGLSLEMDDTSDIYFSGAFAWRVPAFILVTAHDDRLDAYVDLPEPMQLCTECGEQEGDYEDDLCRYCYEDSRWCEDCGYRAPADYMFTDDYGDVWYCEDHRHLLDDESDPDDNEEDNAVAVDVPPVDANTNLSFTPRAFNPDRPMRVISAELEFGSDPSQVADNLYRNGLSSAQDVAGYHAYTGQATAHVEHDASVGGGGELVIGMVSLPLAGETYRLWQSLDALRVEVKNGNNKLDSRCGTHVHVDARDLDLDDVLSTVNVFSYLEDILYRLAAANYGRGHRAQGSNEYCSTIPKNVSKDLFRSSFGNRYLGLNLSTYINARYNCSCGAGFDSGSACRCSQVKSTLEYRLWNGTSNPIKLHAYIALSAALTEYGIGRTITTEEFPAMSFDYRTTPSADVNEVVERLVWMLENLPLSAEERESVRYCIRNSSLGPWLESQHREGNIEQSVVQGILHDDGLLNITPYVRGTDEREVDTRPLVSLRWLNDDFGQDNYAELGCACGDCMYDMQQPEWAIAPFVMVRSTETPIFFDQNMRLRSGTTGALVANPLNNNPLRSTTERDGIEAIRHSAALARFDMLMAELHPGMELRPVNEADFAPTVYNARFEDSVITEAVITEDVHPF